MVQENRVKRPHLLMICGPTAVGKSACAMALAKEWGTEIVSADSVQIYRGLNLGSAKPSAEEQAICRHHLIDIVDPDRSYSVAQYKADFETCVSRFFSNRIPIVCGGTGLYFNAILYEYDFANAFDDGSVRAKWQKVADDRGKDVVFDELRRVDPESASILSPNDLKRVIRALEIFELTGKKKSDLAPKLTDRYAFTIIGLQKEREILYKQINDRVLCMIRAGLVEEVAGLLQSGVDETCQSMQAIGYKEIIAYLKGKIDKEQAIADIQQASRRYAKRQITWFKRMPGIHWLSAEDGDLVGKIESVYRQEEPSAEEEI